MKKVFRLLLVLFMLIAGLAGCNGGTNNKKMNQKQLWEYLSKYPRYLTEWGGEATAFVFDKDDNLTFDNSRGLGLGGSYYFTDLLSFSNENDYLYRLEYENPYPDVIDIAVYYVELNPDDDTRIRFGAPSGGKIIYYDLYADVGLTKDELLKKLGAHDTWREDDGEDMGYYFAKVIDKKKFGFGIMNSGFGNIGDIAKVEYKGYMLYTITVDYEGYEGDEMTDPYDPYTVEYLIYYNHHLDFFKISINGELVDFIPKVDSDDDHDNTPGFDLIAALGKYDIWQEVTSYEGGDFVRIFDVNKFHYGTFYAGGNMWGTITAVKNDGNMNYTITVYYEEYEEYDGEIKEAHSTEYKLYFDPDKEDLIIDYSGKQVKFAPYKGMSVVQLKAELTKYDMWVGTDMYGTDYYFIKVYDNNKFDIAIGNKDNWKKGVISEIINLGKLYFEICVDFPGYYDSYGYPEWHVYNIRHDSKTGDLILIIEGRDVCLKPKK